MSIVWIENCHILASRDAVVELRKEFRKELEGYVHNSFKIKIEMCLAKKDGLLVIEFYNLGDSVSSRYARRASHDYSPQMRRMAKQFGGKVSMYFHGEDRSEVYGGEAITDWSQEDEHYMQSVLSMTNESFSALLKEAEEARLEESRERGRRLQNRR